MGANQDTFYYNGLLLKPLNIIPLMQQSLVKDLQIMDYNFHRVVTLFSFQQIVRIKTMILIAPPLMLSPILSYAQFLIVPQIDSAISSKTINLKLPRS